MEGEWLNIRGTHRILIGDVRQTLRSITPGTVHCCVTSPPYYALRSYLPSGHADKHLELGSERTPEEFIDNLVGVFRLVRECLHPTGTLFVNLGDSYAGSDLMNMPHRLAAALQADGWYWRSTIIWPKKSPMPESLSGWRWRRCLVKVGKRSASTEPSKCQTNGRPHGARSENGKDSDSQAKWSPCPGCSKCSKTGGYVLRKGSWRPTTGHEYVFMFSKSKNYFCDGDAVAEKAVANLRCQQMGSTSKQANIGNDIPVRAKASFYTTNSVETRNPRSVFTLSSESYRGAHFATFPSELVRRLMLAGTSAHGCCPQCLTPFAPVVTTHRKPTRLGTNSKVGGLDEMVVGNRDPERHTTSTTIDAYWPACSCETPEPARPCLVLDPFGGSGTTAQVATWYGRDAVICELNPEYVPMAEARIATMPRCMIREIARKPRPKRRHETRSLFGDD